MSCPNTKFYRFYIPTNNVSGSLAGSYSYKYHNPLTNQIEESSATVSTAKYQKLNSTIIPEISQSFASWSAGPLSGSAATVEQLQGVLTFDTSGSAPDGYGGCYPIDTSMIFNYRARNGAASTDNFILFTYLDTSSLQYVTQKTIQVFPQTFIYFSTYSGSLSTPEIGTSDMVLLSSQSVPITLNVDYLIVGGGGAGGLGYEVNASAVTSGRAPGGGGGAGGLNSGSFTGSLGSTFDIVVGAGGLSNTFTGSNFPIFTGSAQGGTSSISSSIINTSVLGGGYGGFYNVTLYGNPRYVLATTGSSGGGDFPSNLTTPPASGTVGQGNAGARSPSSVYAWRGGGGGGASSAALGVNSNTEYYPLEVSGFENQVVGGYSPGGSGSLWIDGEWYAGGGAGGAFDRSQVSTASINFYYVSGGIGGGGNSEPGNLNAIPNTGGGGGGGIALQLSASLPHIPTSGGNGGSGIVKFRYPTGSLIFNKGETIESGGYYFTTFTETTNDVEIVDIAQCPTTLFNFSGSNITYNHNLGTKSILTNIYDSTGYEIQPNSLTASNNSVDFDFTFPTQGWIVVQQADYSQSFSASTSVNVSHSLNTEDVIVNVFDTNDTLIAPDLITISGSNNVIVDFAFTSSGYITIADGLLIHSFNSVTQSTFNHNLATKNLIVAVYDDSNEEIIPDNIQLVNDNSIIVSFTTPTSGKVVIDRVCRTDNAIFIGTASISQSDDVCIPITVGNDFNNILTWQGTINFDPNVVTFATASNNNIGLTLFNPIPGNLTFSWISPYLTGSNFTSGSTLLELCFSGSNSGSTPVQFTGSPTMLEMADTASNIIDVNYFTGSIEVAALPFPPSTSVYIGTASVSQSNGVCVPITVGDGFENVLTWQGTIAYNEFVLDYVNTTNNNLGITLFNPTSGSLTFSWISPYLTGSTFSSGSTLFEVCFTASEGGFSELEFTSSPTLLEMGDNSGSIFVVDYYTGSIFITPTTSSNIDVTLYLYSTSSEAEYFDILYSSGSDGPWTIAPSGSSIDLLNLYSYTVSIPTGSNYLKLVNKNPEYYPDNFRIHDINFGEPTKGTTPTGSPVIPNLIQSMSGEITIYNDGPNPIEVTNLYMSASVYQQNAFMPTSVVIPSGSSSVFIVDSLPTTGSPITFPNQIELVVELTGSIVSELTGSWQDSGSDTNIYPTAYWSGSLFSSPYTYTYTYFDTKPTFTSESQARIIGTLTL